MAGRIAAVKHVDHHVDHSMFESDDEEKPIDRRRQSVSMEELEMARLQAKSGIAQKFLDVAIICRKITVSDIFNHSIMACIVVAGILVGIQTYPEYEDNAIVLGFNQFVLYAFTLECLLKILAEGFKPWLYFIGQEWKWNVFDFVIVVICLPIWGDLFGGGSVAILRLMRLMRVMKIVKKIPQLQMIMMGLIAGMTSIKYILLLLSMILYLFAIAGIYAFRNNDPQHFESLQLAMLTLFRASTLEDWTDVMYINVYGCDSWYGRSAGYVSPDTATHAVLEGMDSMKVGTICDDNSAQFVLTVVYFILFIVISAFVMLSLFVGAVSMGMADAVDSMKEMEYQQDRNKKLEQVKHETAVRRKQACCAMANFLRVRGIKLQDAWGKVSGEDTVDRDGLIRLLHLIGADDKASNGFDLEDVLQEVMNCSGQKPADARSDKLEITFAQLQTIITEHEPALQTGTGGKKFSFNLMFWNRQRGPSRPGSPKGPPNVNSEERQKRQQLRAMMTKIMNIKESKPDLDMSASIDGNLNHEV